MRQTTYKSIHDVPDELCDALEMASYQDGLLYSHFNRIRLNPLSPHDAVITAFQDDSDGIIGWGALYNFVSFDVCDADFTLMLYVYKQFRMQGIGKSVVTSLLAYADSPVLVWDSYSSGGAEGFFSKFDKSQLILGFNQLRTQRYQSTTNACVR